MTTETLTPAQEAIATADCWTDNAVLPTYSQLLAALQTALRHAREAMPAADRKVFDAGHRGPCWMFTARDLLTRHDRTMRGDFKG